MSTLRVRGLNSFVITAIEVHFNNSILAVSETTRTSQFLHKRHVANHSHLQSNTGGKEETAEWARKAFVKEAGNGRPRMNGKHDPQQAAVAEPRVV